jgi:hypothetical protein
VVQNFKVKVVDDAVIAVPDSAWLYFVVAQPNPRSSWEKVSQDRQRATVSTTYSTVV